MGEEGEEELKKEGGGNAKKGKQKGEEGKE